MHRSYLLEQINAVTGTGFVCVSQTHGAWSLEKSSDPYGQNCIIPDRATACHFCRITHSGLTAAGGYLRKGIKSALNGDTSNTGNIPSEFLVW